MSIKPLIDEILPFSSPAKRIDKGEVIRYPEFRILLDKLVRAIDEGRPILLVGPSGCGKSSLIDLGHLTLYSQMLLYRTSPGRINSGQMYLGMLEARVEAIRKFLVGRKTHWINIESLHNARTMGRNTRMGTKSVLDLLMYEVPIEHLRIIGETTPEGAGGILGEHPRIASHFTRIDFSSLDERAAIEALMLLNAKPWVVDGVKCHVRISRGAATKALHLTDQFVSSAFQPGSSFDLIRSLANLKSKDKKEECSIEIAENELYDTIVDRTGLSRFLIDERTPLDLNELRKHFYSRLVGQREAVECLVDRIALIKAGMTSASRPFGVFLFLGPTGTGKTEICKILAEYIFGDRDRMIRVDMSELSNPNQLWRLLGSSEADDSLVSEVIAQPFSVVLLDEFEKAAPKVWDLFLQVFDDGRLTDYEGNVADFTSTIIVLTSNLGYKRQGSAGFFGKSKDELPDKDDKVLTDTFRPEFLNRLDRIIWFEPLSRASMRKILQLELKRMLARPGFRRNKWAVEWDSATEDLLLEKGFTSTLGARPLVRAIERYLLTPLAKLVASKAAPEGDQFLFIYRNGDQLDVQFVDPDAPAAVPPSNAADDEERLSLAGLTRRARGEGKEFHFLSNQLLEIEEKLQSEKWSEKLERMWEETRQAKFWEDPNRLTVLANIDSHEEIKSRLQSIVSRLDRLGEYEWKNPRGEVIKILTSLSYDLLRVRLGMEAMETGKHSEVFVTVRQSQLSKAPKDLSHQAYEKQCEMYQTWAKLRDVDLQFVMDSPDNPVESTWLVGGLGIVPLLEGEEGYHIWEFRRARKLVKAQIRVELTPVTEALPVDTDLTAIFQKLRAARATTKLPEGEAVQIVRHYREKPKPLVRDVRSGWSSGNLKEVLAGNFDLFTLEHRGVADSL